MTRIAIIAAMPDEVSMLTKRRVLPGHWIEEGQRFICVSGVGADAAAKCCQKAHEAGATAIISWGCAGALTHGLCAGDLIIPSLVSNHNNNELRVCENSRQKLISLLPDTIKVHDGKLIETSSIIAKQHKKQALYESTRAIAVDMESYTIGNYARAHQLDFLVIRAISDTSTTDLPDIIQSETDDTGQILISRIITATLLKPWTIPGLIQVGRQFKLAKSVLATVAKQLDQLPLEQLSHPLSI